MNLPDPPSPQTNSVQDCTLCSGDGAIQYCGHDSLISPPGDRPGPSNGRPKAHLRAGRTMLQAFRDQQEIYMGRAYSGYMGRAYSVNHR